VSGERVTRATHPQGTETTLVAPALDQRITRLPPGGRATVEGEIVYVADGEAVLRCEDEEHRLTPETGAFADGEIEAATQLELVRVRVRPDSKPTTPPVVRYADQEPESAGIGREFRLLAGCTAATQFVGVVPPGRAPMHSHPYDEVAYIVDGEGVLHWEDGTSVPVRRGSCIHFPRLVTHSLENVGQAPLRVMGVFHPAGSPASRAYEEG
jgi:uncharacterized cupin superfamily protein